MAETAGEQQFRLLFAPRPPVPGCRGHEGKAAAAVRQVVVQRQHVVHVLAGQADVLGGCVLR
ncbi:hypothetical protein ACFYRY_00800 [Streptomyces sp. NPDC005263]|uniref:hypothetical protein n=1 Tax=Streptomyces sp. NPDC005263 TaxID=3364711 RepID=UPI0036D028FF